MKSPVELFDEGCGDWGLGDRLPDNQREASFRDLAPIADSCIQGVRPLCIKRPLPEIYFGLINNTWEQNAVADLRDGIGLIGVQTGLAYVLFDAFCRSLSHPKILTHIGDAVVEQVHAQHSDPLETKFNVLTSDRFDRTGKFEIIRPTDPTRLAFSQVATRLVMEFVVFHELAHIVHGHVAYILDSAGYSFLVELCAKPKGKISAYADPITRQVIELDADASAVAWSLNRVSRTDFEPIYPEWRSVVRNQEDVVYIWVFAMTWLFYFWGLTIDFDRLELDGHHPTALRFGLCCSGAREIAKKVAPELAEFSAVFPKAIQDAVAAINELGGNMPQGRFDQFVKDVSDPRALAHYTKLRLHREQIRTEFSKFAFRETENTFG